MSIQNMSRVWPRAWGLVATIVIATLLLGGAASASEGPEDPPHGCVGDVVPDGVVNVVDLIVLLGQWGACPPTLADCNEDGVVDVEDLLIVLAHWGPCE